MDYSKFTDADLVALKSGDISKLSVFGLRTLKQERLKAENPAEYDQESPEWAARVAEKYDPTKDMGAIERGVAGAGKAFADLGRGVGQFVPVRRNGEWQPLVTADDVRESRRLDAPLMNTRGGKVGNFGGNVAALAPSLFIPGSSTIPGAALIGGVTGFLSPAEDAAERAKNTGLGGAFGAGGVLAGRTLSAGTQAVRALVDPMSQSGQQRIAAQTLQAFATDPVKAAANLRTMKPLVPGSVPTMAQAADDVGLAQLERSLASNPETRGVLDLAYGNQRAARVGALKDIAGTDEYLRLIKEGRRTFAAEDYAKALGQKIDPEVAKSLAPQINSLLGRPSIKTAQARAIKLAREADINLSDFSSPQGLDWLKKGLDDVISSAASPTSSVGKEQLRALTQTKSDLMSVMDELMPGYKAANDNFAGMSRNINSMEVARELQKKLEPALARFGANTKEHGSAYAQALESAGESVKRSIGIDKPLRDIMNDADFAMLQNIAKDFARASKAQDLGRAAGSNTAQNLAAQNLLRRTLGPTGLPQSWAENSALQTLLSPYSGLNRMAGNESKVLSLLADAAQDPALAARLLEKQIESMSPGLLTRGLPRVLPVAANAGLLSSSPQ